MAPAISAAAAQAASTPSPGQGPISAWSRPSVAYTANPAFIGA
jgi:hypothetical protein